MSQSTDRPISSKTISLCSAHQQTDPNCPTCNIPLDVRTLDKLVVDGDTLAEIEQGTGDLAGTYMKYRGQIWVNDGWLDDTKARALRDWLTAALSGDSSSPETKNNPPHWTCRTHGDFDAMRAVGCPECMRLAREALKKIARGNVRTCPEVLEGMQTGKLHHCTDYAAIEIAVGALAGEQSAEETKPKPTIEGLERLLQAEDPTPVHVWPDGSVHDAPPPPEKATEQCPEQWKDFYGYVRCRLPAGHDGPHGPSENGRTDSG